AVLERRVFKIRMNGDAEVCRQRPGRRGPDQHENFSTSERRIDERRIALQRKLHVDRWARVLMIFNFSFRERRLVLDAPVNRTRAFVNPATFDKPREHPCSFGFVVVRHREIRVVPLAENSESFEVASLALQRVLSVFTASATETL